MKCVNALHIKGINKVLCGFGEDNWNETDGIRLKTPLMMPYNKKHLGKESSPY